VNIHHLELFYYVARYEGIVAACRHMPYGIQQPAVSSQIASLEEDLGTRLFQRRPFRLTKSGENLYAFAAPFFGRLPQIEAELRGALSRELRLAAFTEVMRDHLPEIIAVLRQDYPDLRLRLIEANQHLAEELLAKGEVDLAITVPEDTLPAGFHSEELLRLPIVLLVPEDSKYTSAAAVYRDGVKRGLPLVSLPPQERLQRLFQEFLRAKGVSWPVSIEASSNELVARYVAQGMGVGVSVAGSAAEGFPGTRCLRLTKAPGLPIAAFWRERYLPPVALAFLELVRERASQIKL